MKYIVIKSLWCPSCIIMNNIYNKLNTKYNLDLTILDYDLDEEEVTKYNPGKILPEFIIVDNSKVINKIIGEKKESEIENILKEYL